MRSTLFIWMLFALPVIGSAAPLAKPEPLSQKEFAPVLDSIHKDKTVDRDTLHRALVSDQTYLRASAARLLGEAGDVTCIPHLIDALSDQSAHEGADYSEAGMATTRYWANDSLKKLTKRDFGFVWNDSKEKRKVAIQKWIKWSSTSGSRR